MKEFSAVLVLFCSFCSVFAAHSDTCSEHDAEVLILGGGMTGVSAANRLQELGITDFILLEAQDRLGGRMRVEEFVPGINMSVGASWIQGVDPAAPRLHPLMDLVGRCGGLETMLSNFDNAVYYDSQGNVVTENLRYGDIEAAIATAAEQSASRQANGDPDITVRQAFTEAGWIPSTPEDNFVEWFYFDFCVSQTPNVTSLFGKIDVATFSDFLADPGNTAGEYYITDRRGYPALIDCLAKNATNNNPSDDRIHLEALVTEIDYSDDCVCVTVSENGGTSQYCAPYAIVTFSVGVLREQAATLFSPPLPQTKLDALDRIVMAYHSVVISVFSERFWNESEFVYHIHPDRGYFANIQILPESRGFNATVLHITDTLVSRLAGVSDEALKQEVTQLHRNIYGDNVPEPSRILHMPWLNNSLFLGSFPNILPGGTAEFKELSKPEEGMYFAGDGVHAKYSGFAHGAFLSGIDAANAIEQRMSSGVMLMGSIVLVLIVAILCQLIA